jgi:hypothetical protein
MNHQDCGAIKAFLKHSYLGLIIIILLAKIIKKLLVYTIEYMKNKYPKSNINSFIDR